MDEEKLLHVKPIYGWGWSFGSKSTTAPAPFDLHVTWSVGSNLIFGQVEGAHPELAGKFILLSHRSDRDYTLFGYDAAPDLTGMESSRSAPPLAPIVGFATL